MGERVDRKWDPQTIKDYLNKYKNIGCSAELFCWTSTATPTHVQTEIKVYRHLKSITVSLLR